MLKTVTASLTTCAILLSLCGSAMAQAPAAPGMRIGWVSTERLFVESKLAQAADAKIEADFSKRQKTLQDQFDRFKALSTKFDSDFASLGEPELTRRKRELIEADKDVQRLDREIREDLMQRTREHLEEGLQADPADRRAGTPRRRA
jgi:outer membrane protein